MQKETGGVFSACPLSLIHISYVSVFQFTQTLKQSQSPVCSFINSIRNAMCHDGVGFLPVQTEKAGDVKNEITDIIFETKSTRGAIKFIT